MRKAWKAIGALDGVDLGFDVFGAEESDEAHWVNGKQLSHVVDDERIELRVTRQVISRERARLKADARVELRKSSSDWITVAVRKPADVALAVELASMAAEQYRPPDGVPSKPPPTGADLDRRRRFH